MTMKQPVRLPESASFGLSAVLTLALLGYIVHQEWAATEMAAPAEKVEETVPQPIEQAALEENQTEILDVSMPIPPVIELTSPPEVQPIPEVEPEEAEIDEPEIAETVDPPMEQPAVAAEKTALLEEPPAVTEAEMIEAEGRPSLLELAAALDEPELPELEELEPSEPEQEKLVEPIEPVEPIESEPVGETPPPAPKDKPSLAELAGELLKEPVLDVTVDEDTASESRTEPPVEKPSLSVLASAVVENEQAIDAEPLKEAAQAEPTEQEPLPSLDQLAEAVLGPAPEPSGGEGEATEPQISQPTGKAVTVSRSDMRDGRVLLRLMESGYNDPSLEVAWPDNPNHRDRLYQRRRDCYGMRAGLLTQDGQLLTASRSSRSGRDESLSGFVRAPSGILPAEERTAFQTLERQYFAFGATQVRVFPRNVDAALLAGLQQILGGSLQRSGTVRAKKELRSGDIYITDIMVDGVAIPGYFKLPASSACRA